MTELEVQKHKDVSKTSFIRAIKEQREITLWYFAKKYGKTIKRVCYPLDFGKSRWGDVRMHAWDVENNHILSIEPGMVERVTIRNRKFDPKPIVESFQNFSGWQLKRSWK